MNASDQTAIGPLNSATPSTAPAEGEDISAGQMLMGALITLGVGVWVFFQLSKLEAGNAESVRVWAPVAAAYNFLGFWPAVSILPTLGLYMTWLTIRRAFEQSAPRDFAA